MKEKLTLIGGLIVIISACFGVYFYFDGKFAHAGDMYKAMETIKKIEIRLDYKILEDRLRGVQKDIYEIEDRYCPDKSKPCTEKDMPELVRKRYRELQAEKKSLNEELNELKAQKKW